MQKSTVVEVGETKMPAAHTHTWKVYDTAITVCVPHHTPLTCVLSASHALGSIHARCRRAVLCVSAEESRIRNSVVPTKKEPYLPRSEAQLLGPHNSELMSVKGVLRGENIAPRHQAFYNVESQ